MFLWTDSGSLVTADFGKITNGCLKGYTVTFTTVYLNQDPSLCSSTNGVTVLKTAFAQIVITNGEGILVCSGSGQLTFNPGVMN